MNPPSPARRVVLTYGTFDLFHIGHLNLLKRLRALGDYLIVAVSTDEFNRGKGKQTIIGFEERIEIVRSCRYVDLAIPETCWEQKIDDVQRHHVSVFGMGADWAGKFDFLREYCEVVYLPRTPDVSSTSIKTILNALSSGELDRMRVALDSIGGILATLGGEGKSQPASLPRGSVLPLPASARLDLRQSA